MDRFVEDCPEVDVGLLQRHGLFVFRGSNMVRIELHGGPVEFSYAAPASHLDVVFLAPRRSAKPQRIGLRAAQMLHGERRYFVCPITGERVSKLYLVGGVLASRKGHGLKHLSQTGRPSDAARARTMRLAKRLTGAAGKGPARGANKSKLIEALTSQGDPRWLDEDTKYALERAKVVKADRAKLATKGALHEGVSTKLAIEKGQASDAEWPEARILEGFPVHLKKLLAGDAPFHPRPKLDTDWGHTRPQLDVRALEGAGLLVPHNIRATQLCWDREIMGVLSYATVVADLSDMTAPYLFMLGENRFEGETYTQVIRLTKAAERWFMICPFSGSRVTILYLRAGLYGSRKVQRLTYKSVEEAAPN